VAGYTPNDAVKQLDSSGKSANTLEVRVMADKIDYVVNGTVVHTTPKSGPTAKTDGIYGIRINHLLEVHVDGFGVTRP
jgi:thiamine monophosphate synthase